MLTCSIGKKQTNSHIAKEISSEAKWFIRMKQSENINSKPMSEGTKLLVTLLCVCVCFHMPGKSLRKIWGEWKIMSSFKVLFLKGKQQKEISENGHKEWQWNQWIYKPSLCLVWFGHRRRWRSIYIRKTKQSKTKESVRSILYLETDT